MVTGDGDGDGNGDEDGGWFTGFGHVHMICKRGIPNLGHHYVTLHSPMVLAVKGAMRMKAGAVLGGGGGPKV